MDCGRPSGAAIHITGDISMVSNLNNNDNINPMNGNMQGKRVAILGAGPSGLATARF